MLVNRRLVWREIDAVDAVISDVAVKPLNLRSDASQDFQRSHGDVPDLLLGHLSGAGDIALNHEFRHGVPGRIPWPPRTLPPRPDALPVLLTLVFQPDLAPHPIRLLVPQPPHRFDPRGAPRRQVGGDDSHGDHREGLP